MTMDAGVRSAPGTGPLTAAGGRPRVAIVGGSPTSAMVATVLCDQFGCAPLNTRTGESILTLLRRRDIQLDLILMDLLVPDMDGFVAVELIRALGARGALPILALADDRAALTTMRARAAGFAGTLVKPYSPRELYAAMHAALAGADASTVTGRA
jgi:CheY-like chemotaxis protein